MILNSAVTFAHTLWASIIKPGALVIDATCGNGHDTSYLSKLVTPSGKVIGFDIQPKAIEETSKRLENEQHIQLICACHSNIDQYQLQEVDLIVYNLGYLPGSDKQVTTLSETTQKSLEKSIKLLKVGGYLSITCYPGHEAGEKEASRVSDWTKNLGKEFDCSQHNWTNRSSKTPYLILIHKKKAS